MPSGNSHRLYVRARHTSFERGKRRSNPNISHLELEGVQTKKDAAFYLGKKVAYIYRAHKEVRGTKLRVIWGSIRRCHGNNGQVRAHFRHNLPPKSLGASVRVMLYPSSI